MMPLDARTTSSFPTALSLARCLARKHIQCLIFLFFFRKNSQCPTFIRTKDYDGEQGYICEPCHFDEYSEGVGKPCLPCPDGGITTNKVHLCFRKNNDDQKNLSARLCVRFVVI